MEPPYAIADRLEPGVVRLLARNPSPFTYFGTQTYLVGTDALAVIDPGPDVPEHVDAIIAAIGGHEVAAIACTHTHRDHSPASRALQQRTGAPIIGCAPLALDNVGPRADAAFDRDYRPDRILADGEAIDLGAHEQLIAVATPGHTSNHLCFAYGDALFTGDHVMGWSTTVVVPPDGDMAAYMRSLDRLQGRDDRIYYPAHGPAVTRPKQLIRGMLGHRLQRERQILRLISDQALTVSDIVASAYPGLDPRLIPAAGGSVLAHLLDLRARGLVEKAEEEKWSKTA